MKSAPALLIFALLSACGPKDGGYHNFYSNITNYSVHPTHITSAGIQIDAGNSYPDLFTLDYRISQIEACLLNSMKNYPHITTEERNKWQCLSNDVNPKEKLKRKYLIIKLVKPFFSNKSDWLFIGQNENSTSPLEAPQSACQAKNLEPPCYWRTAIQNENIIISPNPYLDMKREIPQTSPPTPYLWEIGRMMTGCNLTWYAPHFAKCLSY